MGSNYLWILDNGHAKSTGGKRSPKFSDGTQLFEYEFNRAIVARLVVHLEDAGISYHNLVPEVELDVPVNERARRANDLGSDKPKRYVSIHGNAYGDGLDWTEPHGIQTFYFETSAAGMAIAAVFQRNLVEGVGWRDRGISPSATFIVLKETLMPAVLTENGFFTNQEECRKMLEDEWREKIAQAHFNAIVELEEAAAKAAVDERFVSTSVEPARFLGVVRHGALHVFHTTGPISVHGMPLSLTGMPAGVHESPEEGELNLSPYEGRVILATGYAKAGWLYMADIVDDAGPILTLLAQRVFGT